MATDNNADTSTNTTSANNTAYLVRFPPFPPVPSGVVIISFKDFKERGIRVEPGGEDNETEVDALGVPTISLPSVHSTDWCKTNTKRQKLNRGGRGGKKRKKGRGGAGALNAGPTLLDWDEYWEEREGAYRRPESYDPHAEAFERFYQAAWDFRDGRPWPLAAKQSGPVFVWGEFLRFAGVPAGAEGTTTTAAATSNKRERIDDSDSDLEDDGDEDDPNAGILNVQNLVSVDAAMKAQAKTEAFLKDPALMLKVFFSSYARNRGIIWTDINLTGAPILMRFFINFLIENKALPKREENAIKHESTRRVIDLALKELPLTSKLAKAWPDNFSLACKECWGPKVEVFVFRSLSPIPDVTTITTTTAQGGEGNDQGQGAMTEAAPDATMTDDASTNWNGWGTKDETKAGGDTEQVEGWGDPASDPWGATATTGSGWGSDIITAEGDEDEAIGEWDESKFIDVIEHTLSNDGAINGASNTGWESLEPPTFFPFLGPTALPLTHTTGIVEASVRRIKAVHPPSSDTSKFAIAKGVSAEAVEGHLRRTLGVVIFEPWVNWNKGEEAHLAMPKILSSSRGAIKETAPEGGEAATPSDPAPPGALPPFDPHKDEISVLFEPEHLSLFSIGMGCMCTWVQMVRTEDLEPQDPKKKKKKNAKMERLWYVEESLRVIPSYYTYLG